MTRATMNCDRVNCDNRWDVVAFIYDIDLTSQDGTGCFCTYICWDCLDDEPFGHAYVADSTTSTSVVYGGSARV